jgi:Flagellar hook-length control protein FliK
MTAPAAAPASAPMAPATPYGAPQPQADRFAFAAVLDSLPEAGAKSGGSTIDDPPHRSKEPDGRAPHGRPAGHPPLGDGASPLASLPFALRALSIVGVSSEAADDAPALASVKTPEPNDGAPSIAASANVGTVARLTGERAFHLGVSAFAGGVASRLPAIDAPSAPDASVTALTSRDNQGPDSALAADFSPARAAPGSGFANVNPMTENTLAFVPTRIASRAETPASNRAHLTRAAAHEAEGSGRRPVVSAPPPAAKAPSSAGAPTRAESIAKAKTADGRAPVPAPSGAPMTAQTDPFASQLPGPFLAGAASAPDASAASATSADNAPRVAALVAGPATSVPAVREIDVDLSPGGLEEVSMTMRLAGDKLSVVIRAASSQTVGSIEGARDAIADRLATIGQPLDSLIVRQTGVNTGGNANRSASSADGGSAGGEQRSAQGAGERGGSNDAGLSRRGHSRDRGF